jgi:pimeloyl-ACP methyl ester carboxylesterase
VIPGRSFGSRSGLLAYTALVPERRGMTVHRHEWTGPAPDSARPEVEGWVRDEVVAALDGLPGAPLLIGKSLGTNAAGLAADRGLPAVWLTPLLTTPWVVAALERATAPVLLVGGTADFSWEPVVARRLSRHVLEVEGADHGMLVPGPARASVQVLDRVVAAVETFVDEIGGDATRASAR